MSPRGKHVPSTSASFYASLGRHLAGGIAIVAVVALVIALATRDDDVEAGSTPTTTPTATTTPTETAEPTTEPSETQQPPREPRSRDEITITVLNGNGRSGLASTTSQKFVAAGYTVGTIGDAEPRDKTVIFYKKGAKPEAELLLEDFPDLIRIKPASGSEVDPAVLLTVVLGADYET